MRKIPRIEVKCANPTCPNKIWIRITRTNPAYCGTRCGGSKPSWNKGLTKETSPKLKEIGDKIKATQNSEEWLRTIGEDKRAQISSSKLGGSSWNAGLTKETNSLLKEIGNKISKTVQGRSEEEKKAIRDNARRTTVERLSKSSNKRFTGTKPELKMRAKLKELGIDFKVNYPVWDIEHCYPVDIFIPKLKLIIEVDGERYHNFPEGKAIDHLREYEMIAAGYSVLRIWADMIDSLSQEVLKEYLEIFNADVDGRSEAIV